MLPGTVENVLLFVLLRVQQDDNTPEHEEVSKLAQPHSHLPPDILKAEISLFF